MARPLIIGLAARAGHGKSTAANWFKDNYGATILGFAKPLKEMARELFDLKPHQVYGDQRDKDRTDERWGMSGRVILQRLGMVCRKHLGADIWVQAAMDWIAYDAKRRPGESAIYVIDDVRFPNEAEEIVRRGGRVVKLVCPDAPPPENPNHPSERGVDEIDAANIAVTIVSHKSPGSKDLKDKLLQALMLPQFRPVWSELAAGAKAARTAELKDDRTPADDGSCPTPNGCPKCHPDRLVTTPL